MVTKVGKVDIVQIAPKVFKLKMNTVWFNFSGVHFERALIELSKEHKILSVIRMLDWIGYLLVFVE